MKKSQYFFLSVILLAGAALGGIMGDSIFRPHTAKAQDSGDSLEASLFEVVDANGNVKIQLGMDNDGQPVLMLFDDEGQRREIMSQSEDGTPIFIMSDKNNTPRLIFGVDEESGGLVEMYAKDKKLTWSARK